VEFPDSLIPGRFLERPNRFLTIVDCGGRQVQAHLANTGRLREILVPGRPVFLARSANPRRKTHYSLILAGLECGLVCLDSNIPATVAYEFISDGLFMPTAGYETVRREVTLLGCRYDLLVSGAGLVDFIIEIKGATLVEGNRALFPDAPTQRGTRQIEGLITARRQGLRAAVFFMVMRSDADSFRPNSDSDPLFSRALGEAFAMGVEIHAFSCRVTDQGVWVDREIEVRPL